MLRTPRLVNPGVFLIETYRLNNLNLCIGIQLKHLLNFALLKHGLATLKGTIS